MAVRVKHYTTTLPVGRPGGRRTTASVVSLALHIAVLAFLIRQAIAQEQRSDRPVAAQATERPIALDFAPPRPKPTPRPVAPAAQPEQTPPAVPLTPGPDQTPGSRARVTPTPEEQPNAPPEATRSEATRPDPGSEDNTPGTAEVTQPPTAIAAPAPTSNSPTLESEAQRIFGRPSSKLGPVSGQRDNRPWETPVELSRGCSLPQEEQDSTVPKGMAVVAGRILKEGSSEPLSGARLQILGTQYGTFANSKGSTGWCSTAPWSIGAAPSRCGSPRRAIGTRDVILSVGERISSDVWLPRY